MMRVNARFDAEGEAQLAYLTEMTGLSVSDVLRASVRHHYTAVRAQRSGLRHLTALIGEGESRRADVAGQHKAKLTEGWADRFSRAGATAASESAKPRARRLGDEAHAQPYTAAAAAAAAPRARPPAARAVRRVSALDD